MSHRLRLQSFLNVDRFIWVPVRNAFLAVLLIQVAAAGAEQSEKSTADQAVATDADQTGHLTKIVDPAAAQPAKPDRRAELNLLGQTDTVSGESQRNENVQFNLIENNALKDLLLRMGTTATIVPEFRPDRNYFGAEFGDRIPAQIHVAANPVSTVQSRGSTLPLRKESARTQGPASARCLPYDRTRTAAMVGPLYGRARPVVRERHTRDQP